MAAVRYRKGADYSFGGPRYPLPSPDSGFPLTPFDKLTALSEVEGRE